MGFAGWQEQVEYWYKNRDYAIVADNIDPGQLDPGLNAADSNPTRAVVDQSESRKVVTKRREWPRKKDSSDYKEVTTSDRLCREIPAGRFG